MPKINTSVKVKSVGPFKGAARCPSDVRPLPFERSSSQIVVVDGISSVVTDSTDNASKNGLVSGAAGVGPLLPPHLALPLQEPGVELADLSLSQTENDFLDSYAWRFPYLTDFCREKLLADVRGRTKEVAGSEGGSETGPRSQSKRERLLLQLVCFLLKRLLLPDFGAGELEKMNELLGKLSKRAKPVTWTLGDRPKELFEAVRFLGGYEVVAYRFLK